MKLTTHPPMKSWGNEAPRRTFGGATMTPSERRTDGLRVSSVPTRRVAKGALLSFGMTALVSSLFTMSLVLFRSASNDGDRSLGAMVQEQLARSPGTAGKSRSAPLLAAFLANQTKEVKNQIRFVSALIQQHKTPIEDAEKLAYTIVAESFRANYDPLFVAAVIKSESTFKYSAVSNRGARGLMQIMPTTGSYLVKQGMIPAPSKSGLHDPTYNVKLGIAYLKYLEQRYRGNRERALIAYNWGPGNLEGAMKRGSRIPMQPIAYARKIINNHRHWKRAYSTMALIAQPRESRA